MLTETKEFKVGDLVIFETDLSLQRYPVELTQVTKNAVYCKNQCRSLSEWLTVAEFAAQKPIKVGCVVKSWWHTKRVFL